MIKFSPEVEDWFDPKDHEPVTARFVGGYWDGRVITISGYRSFFNVAEETEETSFELLMRSPGGLRPLNIQTYRLKQIAANQTRFALYVWDKLTIEQALYNLLFQSGVTRWDEKFLTL